MVGAAILPGHGVIDTRSRPAAARHDAPVLVAAQAGSAEPAPPRGGIERVRQAERFRTGGSGLDTGIGGGSDGSDGGTGGVPGGGVGCGAWACIALSLARVGHLVKNERMCILQPLAPWSAPGPQESHRQQRRQRPIPEALDGRNDGLLGSGGE
jgi:hypothetical protein